MRLLLVVSVLFLATPALAQRHWLWERGRPTGNHLNAADALNANAVVAVGDRGEVLRWNGSSWFFEPTFITTNLRGVDLVSASLAFLVGDSGLVMRNTGTGWSNIASVGTVNLLDVSFRDSMTGVIASRGSGVFYTSNGGATAWQQATGVTGIIWDIAFVPGATSTTVFATNGVGLFVSTNSGATFTQVSGSQPVDRKSVV